MPFSSKCASEASPAFPVFFPSFLLSSSRFYPVLNLRATTLRYHSCNAVCVRDPLRVCAAPRHSLESIVALPCNLFWVRLASMPRCCVRESGYKISSPPPLFSLFSIFILSWPSLLPSFPFLLSLLLPHFSSPPLASSPPLRYPSPPSLLFYFSMIFCLLACSISI